MPATGQRRRLRPPPWPPPTTNINEKIVESSDGKDAPKGAEMEDKSAICCTLAQEVNLEGYDGEDDGEGSLAPAPWNSNWGDNPCEDNAWGWNPTNEEYDMGDDPDAPDFVWGESLAICSDNKEDNEGSLEKADRLQEWLRMEAADDSAIVPSEEMQILVGKLDLVVSAAKELKKLWQR